MFGLTCKIVPFEKIKFTYMVRVVGPLILAIIVILFIIFLLPQTTGTFNKGVKVEFLCEKTEKKSHEHMWDV